jgi:large conductance mechanosensitive channel
VLGGVDFSDIALILQQAEGDSPAVTIGIGLFINAVINFLIIAAVVFLMVRSLNRLMEAGKKEEEEAPAEPPAPTTDELMLEELRALRQLMEKQDAS